jgi:hypothetical protein
MLIIVYTACAVYKACESGQALCSRPCVPHHTQHAQYTKAVSQGRRCAAGHVCLITLSMHSIQRLSQGRRCAAGHVCLITLSMRRLCVRAGVVQQAMCASSHSACAGCESGQALRSRPCVPHHTQHAQYAWPVRQGRCCAAVHAWLVTLSMCSIQGL